MQELKFIQDKLNNLCSEHDELMTVLEIYDFIPNIKSWQLLNKNISSKISMYEQQIEEMESHHSRVKMREQIHQKSVHDDAKTSISTIQKKMNDLKATLEKHQSKLSTFELKSTATSKQKIQHTKNQVQGKVNRHYQQLNSAIVEYKTSLQLTALGIKQLNVNNAGVLDRYASICLAKQNYDYDKLAHQIELFKLELGKPDFTLFFDFTYQDIKQSIQRQIQYLSLTQKHMSLSGVEKSRSYKKETLSIIYNSYLNLSYRIKGIKNAAANELLMMYAEQQNKMNVNKLQKRINAAIRELEGLADLLQDDILQFRDAQQL